SRGAQIGPYSTNVRSLAVRSIPIGGDSAILIGSNNNSNGNFQDFMIEDYRRGPAYCLGGINPTPTDAMRYLNLIEYGDYAKAEEGLALLLPPDNRNPLAIQMIAKAIIETMVSRIASEVESLQKAWTNEPAYKVWEVLHPNTNQEFNVLVSGGGGIGISSALRTKLKAKVQLVKHPEVSNAIGAAMAKTTFSCTLHLDTVLGRYRIEETGEQGEWSGSRKPHREVEDFLYNNAKAKAEDMGIDFGSLQTDSFDFFPIIQGWNTAGQIVRGAVHVPAGVMGRIQ
ncbi:MAG: hydantoinase/oxoprolinase family protein, partial [Desulfitobacterium hafniense]|nr:hydantoinase/oxoprolinase family protein [Desulfitobacterium hafniense]